MGLERFVKHKVMSPSIGRQTERANPFFRGMSPVCIVQIFVIDPLMHSACIRFLALAMFPTPSAFFPWQAASGIRLSAAVAADSLYWPFGRREIRVIFAQHRGI